MRRTALAIGLLVLFAGRVHAQTTSVVWKELDVVTHLNNDGRAEVRETHQIAVGGEVGRIDRDFNFAADQSAVIHGVFRLGPDGSRIALKNAPVDHADCYQAYRWGLQFSLRGEQDPAIEPATRTYVIEYTLVGAITPSWDLAAGRNPLDAGTQPRHPLERAREVIAGWREAWPQLDRNYRFDHDVVFPTRGSSDRLLKLNYRLEYDTAWVLLDKERDIGVATPDVDYRVQRILQYLPDGRPKEVDVQAAALRIGAVVGPLVLGLLLGFLFLAADRLTRPASRVDRAVFETLITSMPKELVAAHFGSGRQSPSLEGFLVRLAAQKKVAISVETPETDETPAKVRLRLTTDRGKLQGFEREIIDALFGGGDTVSTDDIRERHRGREFDPDDVVSQAFDRVSPKGGGMKRPLWSVLHLGLMAGGLAVLVKSLIDHNTSDPAPILAGLIPGNAIVGIWPTGSTMRRASLLRMLVAIIVLGLLGATLALIPNTPLSGLASLGLGLLSVGHCVGYLARLPKPSRADLDLGAAREWALAELKRPHPALRDAWVDSLEAMGAGRALSKWRERYGSGQTSAPDLADMGASEMPSGPPFTGEAPPSPTLPPNWADGFSVYSDGDDD